eukprot:61623-Heterocapsa_arctica.AAC.1
MCLRAEYVNFHNAYELNAQREKVRLLELELNEQSAESDRLAQEADRDSNKSLPSDDELTSSLTGPSSVQEQKQMICEQLFPAIL